ncbi:MAG TPA: hypothetical protein VFC24_16500 [Casimicrobiaceae bacterium]|nr:hypothetical protein [Casimicrobiaceae bacterium]
MKKGLMALALAGALGAVALPTLAQTSPPPLPALSAEQSENLNREMTRYRADVDARVARGELSQEEAQKLIEWRRWQLARQIAGLTPPEPPRVVVQREYVYPPPPAYYYDPWYRPYPYYWGPRVSVCAGGWGRHSFGSVCF